jgi:uncharacterized protein
MLDMRWTGGRRSQNVDDRRRIGGGGLALGGGGIVVALLVFLLGGDPSVILGGGGQPVRGEPTAEEDELAEMVSVVLADTEDVWSALFARSGRDYEEPRLVLFRDAQPTACGFQQSAVGPFYCPGDRSVYIDLSFYDDLRRLGAPGDFAQAYVIAHEVGHHVQNLLGTSRQVEQQMARASAEERNELSVRLELQADFYAGVWAHHAERARGILEQGDVEEALGAAAAIGDDRLQRRSRGYVAPETFTHGTSEQRARWFRRGLESGDVARGDTFAAREL